MAGKPKYEWPPVEEVVALVQRYGQDGTAEKLGVSRGAVANFLRKNKVPPEKRRKSELVPLQADVGEVDETEVLRQRVRELEAQARARRKIEVVEHRILEAFENAIEARKPVYNPKVIRKKPKEDEHEFVLLWSDTHAGEVVSEVETNGINAYDWQTMLKRLDRIREGVFSFQENRPYPVRKLHIAALGDMLSGNIHDELVETNESPLAECTVQLGEDGSVFIESFLEGFDELTFSGVVGNHPRAKRKPQAKLAFDNADWLAYRIMELALRKESRISFDVPKAATHPIMVCKRRLLLMHGDGIRSTMPGVPWGGVMRRVTSLDRQYTSKGMPIDHYLLGHFHQGNVVDQGRIMMNGSVKGPDEYTIKAFGYGSPPQQLLATFHPRHGLTDVSFIDLDG